MSWHGNPIRAVWTGTWALMLALASAQAPAEGFWYLGAGGGLQSSDTELSRASSTPLSCQAPFTVPFASCVVETDEESLSLSVFGGYQATPYLGIELGFVNLPDSYLLRVTDPSPAFPVPPSVLVEQDTRAAFLRGVLTLPMSHLSSHRWLVPVSASAVFGAVRWSSEASLAVDVVDGLTGRIVRTSTADGKQSGTDLTFGARVNYDFTEQVRLSAAWDRYMDLGANSVAISSTRPLQVGSVATDVDVFSVNLSYRFR